MRKYGHNYHVSYLATEERGMENPSRNLASKNADNIHLHHHQYAIR